MELAAYHRDTWAEIDLDAIEENVKNMKSHLPAETAVIAVVKANGYGHGAYQVAKAALEAGASGLAVAFLDEALALRNRGLDAPILVMGAARPQDAGIAARNHVTLTVFQEDWIREAANYLSLDDCLQFHVKLDTGMGRLGIRNKAELLGLLDAAGRDSRFQMKGAFTHFATADEHKTDYFETQYSRFVDMIGWFPEKPELIHCANSATGLRFPDKAFNAVRFGISMYGLSPSSEIKPELPFPLKEAFSFHSRLVHVKKLPAGESVSYGATYTAEEDVWIGTIPVGYADGWLRSMKGWHVLVDGKIVPIAGRVCMDQFMVLLPEKLPVGTQVTLLGSQHGKGISIDEAAKHLGTINYEVPCIISARVPRIFLRNKSIIEVSNPILNG